MDESRLLTRRQALEQRSAREVDALVRSGAWLAVRRGIYLTVPALPVAAAPRHAVLVQAAVLATGVPAVGSHESAAVVHDLPLLSPYDGAPVVTRLRAPAGARTPAQPLAPLASQVPPEHRLRLHGADVTSLARTAVDLARTRSDLVAVIALDAALRRTDRQVVQQVLAAQRGWPGAARALRHLAFADGLAESALESLGRLRIAQLGLPPPQLQVVLSGSVGPLARVDYYWPEHRTVGEADGMAEYAGDHALLVKEKLREDALRDEGFEVFRFTWDEALRRPAVLRERALRAFARGGRASRAA